MADNDKQESKIIVDDDWKAQAKAQKEQLGKTISDKQKEQGDSKPAGDDEKKAQANRGPLPEADLSSLIHTLATQVIYALGGIEDPQTGKSHVDLDLAKYHIDTLAMIEKKTEGNRSDDESNLIDQALYQIRMQYVKISQS